MKNIKYFAFALLSLSLLNCSSEDDNGQVVYGGAPLLNFLNQGGEQQLSVISNTNSVVTTVKIGTFAAVSGSHTVKIVPDLVNSTAVLGEDYVILNNTDILENGESVGEFKIEFFKDPAIESGKKVSFTLESDLPQAVFNTKHVINIKLSCPVEALEGDFRSNTYWYGGLEAIHTIEKAAAGASQITIKNFWSDNIGTTRSPNFVLNFDESNFVISGFSIQQTGRFVAGATTNAGQIRAIPTTGQVSRFNPCTRVVTLYVTYQIPKVGESGYTSVPKIEVFNGIDIE